MLSGSGLTIDFFSSCAWDVTKGWATAAWLHLERRLTPRRLLDRSRLHLGHGCQWRARAESPPPSSRVRSRPRQTAWPVPNDGQVKEDDDNVTHFSTRTLLITEYTRRDTDTVRVRWDITRALRGVRGSITTLSRRARNTLSRQPAGRQPGNSNSPRNRCDDDCLYITLLRQRKP